MSGDSPNRRLGFPGATTAEIIATVRSRQFGRGWSQRPMRFRPEPAPTPKLRDVPPGPASRYRAVIYGGAGES